MQAHLISFASPVLLTDLTIPSYLKLLSVLLFQILQFCAFCLTFKGEQPFCQFVRPLIDCSCCGGGGGGGGEGGGGGGGGGGEESQKKNYCFPYSWRTKATTFPAALHACLN